MAFRTHTLHTHVGAMQVRTHAQSAFITKYEHACVRPRVSNTLIRTYINKRLHTHIYAPTGTGTNRHTHELLYTKGIKLSNFP